MKKIFLFCLMACLSITIRAEIASGTCGEHLTWALSDEGVLAISGEGTMSDYFIPFDYKNQIKSVFISDGVTNIGEGAFSNCENLITIWISESITSIGNRAFSYCTSLSSVSIPNSVTDIGDYAFSNCHSLSSIIIPESVINIDSRAFYDCYFVAENFINNSKLYDQEYWGANIYDSETIDGLLIKDNVAAKCRPLTTVVNIPSSVTSIGSRAFYKCNRLTSVTIPTTVTSIGDYAFYESGLTSITIPNSVTDIGIWAFYGCSDLTSANIPEGLTYINMRLFGRCALESITIPNSVTGIGIEAFEGCPFTSVSIPNSVTEIYTRAFARCSRLTSIRMSNNITDIDNYAFEDCSMLTSITIPNTITNISVNAFEGCYFAVDSFINNSGLLDSNNWGAVICDRETSEGLLIKENETKYCRPFTPSITIPSSVISIGPHTFFDCGHISSIHIPSSVEILKEESFATNYGVDDIYCHNVTPPTIHPKAFWYYYNITLHVPINCAGVYESADVWKNFTIVEDLPNPNIIELSDGEPYTNTRRKTCDAVTFTKTFASAAVNKWNAFYVPININVENYTEDFDIAEIYAFCSTVDTNGDGTVDANDERFLFVRPLTAGRTYPNTPYLIRPREAKTYVINSADNILYEKRDGKVEFSTTKDKFTVTGLNENFTVVADDNNYYVTGSGGLSYRTSGSTTVRPNRWVMHREDKEYSDIPDYVEDGNHLDNEDNGDAGVKEYRIIAIGEEISETDAITAVKNANGVFTSDLYSVDGRKLNDSKNLPNGIYIKNGKKFMVK